MKLWLTDFHNKQLKPYIDRVRTAAAADVPGMLVGQIECGANNCCWITPAFLDHDAAKVIAEKGRDIHVAPKPIEIGDVGDSFQNRVVRWMKACFSEAIAKDRTERNHRFLEEALELVQAGECTASEAHQLVDYVFGRPVGVMAQEVGGVLITLAALCNAFHMPMDAAAEVELARVWTVIDKIRAKQLAKPKHSPLPGP